MKTETTKPTKTDSASVVPALLVVSVVPFCFCCLQLQDVTKKGQLLYNAFLKRKWLKETPMIKEKTNRNDPCPCGSGKKYKKCCALNPLKRKIKVLKAGVEKSLDIDLFGKTYQKQIAQEESFQMTKRDFSAGGVQKTAKTTPSSPLAKNAASSREELDKQLHAADKRKEEKFTPTTKDFSNE
ncbi:SEC-C domain-containing protein [Simkania negevensis]|uniref:SEC-C domain-containing protein n=1 Tax=Simkania negevensis TaxID=83561 RepID=A0ABS3APU0_9BACT|nr:SEC-C domain-containing protein [Simkania negevensis]